MKWGRRTRFTGDATRVAVSGLVVALGLFAGAGPAAAESRSVDLGGGTKLELVSIPPGTFVQGSKPTDVGHQPDEAERQVRISKSLYVGVKPVTRAEWRRFVGSTSYKSEAETGTSGGFGWEGGKLVQKKEFNWQNPGFVQTEDDPVVLVTWGDAIKFIEWANTRSGDLALRLPTEAELEYAAHGGKATLFPWGDSPKDADANAHFNQIERGGTRPSGVVAGNGFGLYDVAGNVWQWTSDYHGPIAPDAATDPAVSSPVTWQFSDKPRRVLKGGSWLTSDRMKLRPAARNRATEGSRNADFGFRVVAEKGAPKPTVTPGHPSAPAAPGSASPVKSFDRPDQPSEARRPPSVGLTEAMFIVVPVGIALGVIVWALRRGKKVAPTPVFAGPAPRGQSPYRTKLGTDGFWIQSPKQASGQKLGYRAHVAGRSFRGTAVLSSADEGTFVYTGSPPESVDLDTPAEAAAIQAAYGGAQARSYGSSAHPTGSSSYDGASTYGSSTHDSSSSYGSSTYDSSSSSNDSGSSGWPSAY